jgi:predicted house-cleaning noncanonical NTP pyrophosphatase (MazG superfamily)
VNITSDILFSKHFEVENSQEITVNLVGQKAVGLLDCSPEITPPFFIITSSLFKDWRINKISAQMALQKILANYSDKLNPQGSMRYIVRSSAKYESFDERGYYKSSQGGTPYGNLLGTITEVWRQNIEGFSKFSDNEFAIVIQQYIKPKLSGHLSNERRISRNEPEWLIEIANSQNQFQENAKFRVSPKSVHQQLQALICINKTELISNLKNVATAVTEKGIRCHLEWVWDGKRAWIVQKDIEDNSYKGTLPGSLFKRSKKIIEKKELTSFNTVATTKNNWKKIKCIKTFINCNLPYGEVYILEQPATISNISKGIFEETLIKDLEWLLTYPVVIRMDIKDRDEYNSILLPRTETLYKIEQTKIFLTTNSSKFLSHGLKDNEFCFLIHRFIISKACSLAFSKPNLQKARIDSTWGIVEGLYYHPHDSFEVNLINHPPQIKKQIRCKTEYIDADISGKWFSKKAGMNWDWAESLTKEQILRVAGYNTKIADHLNSPVTVMYFVDVDRATGYSSILPWYYTIEEITENSEKFSDAIFSENRELIQSLDDFNNFKQRIDKTDLLKTTIKLKLKAEILREKTLIETIGEFAKSKNIPIELEGSILSHTYYILRKVGTRVKCTSQFEPKYKKQKFYKLVRDKIPINIESKGERVRTIKINSKDLLKFLKKKAIEEANEFYWENEHDQIIEELADLYEVIRASCKIFGVPIKELEKIADKKSEKKGGFEAGLVLLDTTESSLIDVVDSSGQSLLINDSQESGTIIKRRNKLKVEKITFGTDNSIILPYINGNDNSDNKELSAPVSLEEVESIKIEYTPRGIKIKFIKRKDNPDTRRQLSLF